MFFPLIYWVFLPLGAAALVIRWIDKKAPRLPPADVAALFERSPVEKKWFRAVRRDARGLAALGDYETQPDAVDRAYQGKEEAQKAGEAASFLVYNWKAELLEQVDA
jgi:hypothetical protein